MNCYLSLPLQGLVVTSDALLLLLYFAPNLLLPPVPSPPQPISQPFIHYSSTQKCCFLPTMHSIPHSHHFNQSANTGLQLQQDGHPPSATTLACRRARNPGILAVFSSTRVWMQVSHHLRVRVLDHRLVQSAVHFRYIWDAAQLLFSGLGCAFLFPGRVTLGIHQPTNGIRKRSFSKPQTRAK